MPTKTMEASHKIISVTLLATGRLIMATEKRMYELVNNVWEPMVFADDPADVTAPSDPAATAAPAATVAPPWSDPAAETTGETHS